MWPAAAPAAVHFVRPGAVHVEALSTDTNLRVLAFGRNGRMTVVLINGSGAQAANIVNLPVGAYGLCQSVGGSACQELSVQVVAAPRGGAGAGVLAVTVPANTVMTVCPYAGTNQPPVVTDFKAAPDFLTLTAAGRVPPRA
jgi:hypothetical protein